MMTFAAHAKSVRTAEPYLKKKNVYAVPQAYLDKTFSDLASVLQTARAVPYKGADGKFSGFELESIEKTSELRKLGFLPGDVMTQVNDVALDNAGKGLEAFQTIRFAKVIKVHLLRKKKRLVLTYEKAV